MIKVLSASSVGHHMDVNAPLDTSPSSPLKREQHSPISILANLVTPDIPALPVPVGDQEQSDFHHEQRVVGKKCKVSPCTSIDYQNDLSSQKKIRPSMARRRQVTSSQHIKQMSSKRQDHATSGSGIDLVTKEKFTYYVIFDGHGTDSCINFIRKLDTEKMSQIMSAEDPVLTLANYITSNGVVGRLESSGSTMNMIRFYDNRLECFNCGDSQAIVFIDGVEVFKTEKHNYANEEERKRVTALGCKFMESRGITVADEENLHGSYSERVVFPKTAEIPIYLCLVPTQALGHNSKTGYTTSKHVIPMEGSSKVRAIIASDGVWDMRVADSEDSGAALFPMTAEEISKQSEARWMQPWRMTTHATPEAPARVLPQKLKLKDFDDVSVLVVDSSPMMNMD